MYDTIHPVLKNNMQEHRVPKSLPPQIQFSTYNTTGFLFHIIQYPLSFPGPDADNQTDIPEVLLQQV